MKDVDVIGISIFILFIFISALTLITSYYNTNNNIEGQITEINYNNNSFRIDNMVTSLSCPNINVNNFNSLNINIGTIVRFYQPHLPPFNSSCTIIVE